MKFYLLHLFEEFVLAVVVVLPSYMLKLPIVTWAVRPRGSVVRSLNYLVIEKTLGSIPTKVGAMIFHSTCVVKLRETSSTTKYIYYPNTNSHNQGNNI